MWNKLSMKDRAEYIKLGVANGITSLDEIRKVYNKYAEGGSVTSENSPEKNRFLGLTGEEWGDIGTSMIPIYGTYKDAKEFYNEPSWENGLWLGASVVSEIPIFKWLKLGKAAKAAKAIDTATEVAENYKKAKRTADRLRVIPNIKPSRVREASGNAGRLYQDMIKTTREAQQAKEASKYFHILPELSITGGAVIDYANKISDINNQYAEGGLKDSWKPWYWSTPKYEGSSLKEAIFKAYDDGLEGKDILYNDKAYKVLLSDSDLNEYKTRKQHELNRGITNEQVVDSYIDNVLYTMENPTNAGYIKGKYFPYADSSSPNNLGPGINYTSNMAKGLDFSGKKGYTKEELNDKMRPHLLENMEGIMSDLHNMYGEDVDTMSLGNRMILLDISHNVRPRGKRANMPKKWPSLINGMVTGDTEKIRKNTNSGSIRRQNMRNDLIFQNIITPTTVTNR